MYPLTNNVPSADGWEPATYLPKFASEFACARANNAACAAGTFSAFPCHALSVDCCNARPYENVNDHGPFRLNELIVLR